MEHRLDANAVPGAALTQADELAPADEHLAGPDPGETHQVGPAARLEAAPVHVELDPGTVGQRPR